MGRFHAVTVVILMILCIAELTLAKVYTIGDSDGWRPNRDYYTWANIYTVGDSDGWRPNRDYYTWANSHNYFIGDVLELKCRRFWLGVAGNSPSLISSAFSLLFLIGFAGGSPVVHQR
ncbi:hypothetical protein LguiA_013289 [Lonicera macranthoides]